MGITSTKNGPNLEQGIRRSDEAATETMAMVVGDPQMDIRATRCRKGGCKKCCGISVTNREAG